MSIHGISWSSSGRSSKGDLGDSKYLQLSQGETTAGANAAVVLDRRASHNRAELVDGTGGHGGSLGLTSVTSRDLLSGLYSKSLVRFVVRYQV